MVRRIDVSENFGRQPIKHVVHSRKAKTMYCDKCRYGRRLVWHAELNRIVCPECGQTPQVVQDKLAELDAMPHSQFDIDEKNRPKIVTADGFQSSGSPANLTSMKMRAKFGPRAYSTINKEEFGPVDEETKAMVDSNPSYRLVDYREEIRE